MAIYDNYKQTMQGSNGGYDQIGNEVRGNGIMTPIVQLHGGSHDTPEGRNNMLLAYNIDVYNDIKKYAPERHPILTALMANSKPADLSKYVVSETNEDKEFFDNFFGTLRRRNPNKSTMSWNKRPGYLNTSGGTDVKMPMAMSESTFVGGALQFTPVATSDTTAASDFVSCAYAARATDGAETIMTSAIAATGTEFEMQFAKVRGCASTDNIFDGKRVAAFAFKASSGTIIGSASIVVDHHWANFAGLGFEATKNIKELGTTPLEVWSGLERTENSNAAYMLFDNLGVSVTYDLTTHDLATNTISNLQQHAVKVGIHQFWRNATWDKFIVVLDMGDINIDVDWNTFAGANDGNWLLMKEVAVTGDCPKPTLQAEGYTYFYPCFVSGAAYGKQVPGVPEGSSKRGGNTFKRNFRNKINYTQIFRADAWSVTGTKMAERKARFTDDWADTRETNLFLYKDQMTQAFLWNRASEEDIYNNNTSKFEVMRTTSGIWDRELNDYKIVRLSLNNYQTSTTSLQASNYIKQFINEVGRSVTSFKDMRSKPTVTVACSMALIEALGELEDIGKSGGPNLFGKMSMGELGDSMKRLGVPTLKYETPRVSLIFMWDPALDYATNFPLPSYITGSGVVISPRKIMMIMDVKNIGIRTLRADKLQAGIQNIGDDKYEEDILGEHGVEVLNSRLNTIYIVD